jgi:hypothetical protein
MSSNCSVVYPKHSLLREQKISQYIQVLEEDAQNYVWRDSSERAYWNKRAQNILSAHARGNKTALSEAVIRHYAGSKNTRLIETKLLSEGFLSSVADFLGAKLVNVMKNVPGYKTNKTRNWWMFGGGGKEEDARYQEAYDQAKRLEMSKEARAALGKYFADIENYIKEECGTVFPNNEGEGSGQKFKDAIDLVVRAALAVRVSAGDPKVFDDMQAAGIPVTKRPSKITEFAITKEEGDEIIAGLRKRLMYWDRKLEQRYALAMESKVHSLPKLAEIYLHEAPDDQEKSLRASDLGKKGLKTSTMQYLESSLLPKALCVIGASGMAFAWLVKQGWFINSFKELVLQTSQGPDTLRSVPAALSPEQLQAITKEQWSGGATQWLRNFLPVTDNANMSSYQIKDMVKVFAQRGFTDANGVPTSNLLGMVDPANLEAFQRDWTAHVVNNFSKNPSMTLGKALPLSSAWGKPGGTLTLRLGKVIYDMWPTVMVKVPGAAATYAWEDTAAAVAMKALGPWAMWGGAFLFVGGASSYLMRRHGAKNSRASYINAALKMIDDINLPEVKIDEAPIDLPPSPIENKLRNDTDLLEKIREALSGIDDPRAKKALEALTSVAEGKVIRPPPPAQSNIIRIVLQNVTKEGDRDVTIQLAAENVGEFLNTSPDTTKILGITEPISDEKAQPDDDSTRSTKEVTKAAEDKYSPATLATARLFLGIALKRVGYQHQKEIELYKSIKSIEDPAGSAGADDNNKKKQLSDARRDQGLIEDLDKKLKSEFINIAKSCDSVEKFEKLIESSRRKGHTLAEVLHQVNVAGIDPADLLSGAKKKTRKNIVEILHQVNVAGIDPVDLLSEADETDTRKKLISGNNFIWDIDADALEELFSYANNLRNIAVSNSDDFEPENVIRDAKSNLKSLTGLGKTSGSEEFGFNPDSKEFGDGPAVGKFNEPKSSESEKPASRDEIENNAENIGWFHKAWSKFCDWLKKNWPKIFDRNKKKISEIEGKINKAEETNDADKVEEILLEAEVDIDNITNDIESTEEGTEEENNFKKSWWQSLKEWFNARNEKSKKSKADKEKVESDRNLDDAIKNIETDLSDSAISDLTEPPAEGEDTTVNGADTLNSISNYFSNLIEKIKASNLSSNFKTEALDKMSELWSKAKNALVNAKNADVFKKIAEVTSSAWEALANKITRQKTANDEEAENKKEQISLIEKIAELWNDFKERRAKKKAEKLVERMYTEEEIRASIENLNELKSRLEQGVEQDGVAFTVGNSYEFEPFKFVQLFTKYRVEPDYVTDAIKKLLVSVVEILKKTPPCTNDKNYNWKKELGFAFGDFKAILGPKVVQGGKNLAAGSESFSTVKELIDSLKESDSFGGIKYAQALPKVPADSLKTESLNYRWLVLAGLENIEDKRKLV